MQYEICKEINIDGTKGYSVRAWSDVLVHAQQIVHAMSVCYGGNYVVCMDGKPLEKDAIPR